MPQPCGQYYPLALYMHARMVLLRGATCRPGCGEALLTYVANCMTGSDQTNALMRVQERVVGVSYLDPILSCRVLHQLSIGIVHMNPWTCNTAVLRP